MSINKKAIRINKKAISITIQIMVWAIVLGLPLIWGGPNDGPGNQGEQDVFFSWQGYGRFLITPLSFMVVFYLNYFYLIDRFLSRKKVWAFLGINVALIVLLTVGIHHWHRLFDGLAPWQNTLVKEPEGPHLEHLGAPEHFPTPNPGYFPTPDPGYLPTPDPGYLPAPNPGYLPAPGPDHLPTPNSGPALAPAPGPGHLPRLGLQPFHNRYFGFAGRWTFLLMLIVGLSVAIRMTGRWFAQREAELIHLRNQVNPHFLFNSLNTIYSLIETDPNKAQEAVHGFSRILRHSLYDNSHAQVTVQSEIEALQYYVELMTLRLPPFAKVVCSWPKNEDPRNQLNVAPMLFLPIIENAFKHGVSTKESSDINLSCCFLGNETISLEVSNTDFHSENSDREQEGIGLNNLRKRLAILYHGQYELQLHHCENRYVAHLIIKLIS